LKEKSVFPAKLRKLLHNTFVKDRYLWRLIKITLVVKLLILLIVVFSYRLLPFCERCYKENFIYPKNEEISWISGFKTWDAQHYLYLAEKGYKQENQSSRFYPLYPLLIKTFSLVFDYSFLIIGLLLSNIFSAVAVVIFYLLVKKFYDKKTAFIAGMLLLAFPTAFYLSLVYTEALFLMLAVCFFYSFYTRKYLISIFLAFLIPLSRPQGLLVICAYVVFLLINFIRKGIKNTDFVSKVFILLSFILGAGAYFLFLKYFTGSFFSIFEAHKNLKSGYSVSGIFDPAGWFLNNFILTKLTLHGFATSMIDRFSFFVYLLILFWAYKKIDLLLFCYLLFLGLFPAMTGLFTGYMRFLLVVFPIYIVLALKFKKKYLLIVVLMFGLQLIFLIMHSLNYWVA